MWHRNRQSHKDRNQLKEHLLRGDGTRAEETTTSGLESACAAGQKGVCTPSAWQVGLVTCPTRVLCGPAQPGGLCLSCSLHAELKWRQGSGAPTRALGKQPRCGHALVARSSSEEEVFFRQPGKHTERHRTPLLRTRLVGGCHPQVGGSSGAPAGGSRPGLLRPFARGCPGEPAVGAPSLLPRNPLRFAAAPARGPRSPGPPLCPAPPSPLSVLSSLPRAPSTWVCEGAAPAAAACSWL
nr:uncharacterized protein LOC108385148 isoform X2 [Manis javanica]